ncbi:MAG: methylmalonyl Co-A mutase-associated GTPase MeaB [Chloroflexi bacterium]|nr:methylmalonyl Co-A mutase-associated GTPase MeaB [Chloroflexota bacterium]
MLNIDLADRVLKGELRALSRALTLLERGNPAAGSVMKRLDPHTGRAYTVGITGPPGVGKSTLVDRLAEHLRGQELTVGILAVDPTSPFTGGALLGDRIRMQRHYLDDGVFIRSVATRGQSGGLPRIVKSMVRALDAAGKDVVLVETVGVGQTELGIMGVADSVVVAMTPESGDSIQTLKAGVMEIADLYVINKADRDGANHLATAVTSMLHMADLSHGWNPQVLLTQAYANVGISELWDGIGAHRDFLTDTGGLNKRRAERRRSEFLETVQEELHRRITKRLVDDGDLADLLNEIEGKAAEPYGEAMRLLDDDVGLGRVINGA